MSSNDCGKGLLQGGTQDFSTEFYLTQFKITPCSAAYPHDWSACPFVHPNEKARRRDPRLHHFLPVPCPNDGKGINCPRKDACQFTHNVYEYWLHPSRFRTQLCHLGTACTRPICFFAHRVSVIRCPDKEEAAGKLPLATSAQQPAEQQQQLSLPAVAVSQAVPMASNVRLAVAQLEQAAVLQGQQQAAQQAQSVQQQLQQMTLQLQQMQMVQGPSAGAVLMPAVTAGVTAGAQLQQQQYVMSGQFTGWFSGSATGTSGQVLAGAQGGLGTSPSNSQQGYGAFPQQQYQSAFPQLQQSFQVAPFTQQYGQQLPPYMPTLSNLKCGSGFRSLSVA